MVQSGSTVHNRIYNTTLERCFHTLSGHHMSQNKFIFFLCDCATNGKFSSLDKVIVQSLIAKCVCARERQAESLQWKILMSFLTFALCCLHYQQSPTLETVGENTSSQSLLFTSSVAIN